MYRKSLHVFLVLLAVSLVVEGVKPEEMPPVTVNVSVPPELANWLNWTSEYVTATSGGALSTSSSLVRSVGDMKEALKSGTLDIAVSGHPFVEDGTADAFMHFPIGVGGIVFLAHVKSGRTVSLTARQVADLLSGQVTKWSDPNWYGVNQWMSAVEHTVKVAMWGEESTETRQVKEFLEKNTDAKWTPLTKFAASAAKLSSVEQAVSYVRDNPGAITWAPYHMKLEGIMPVQLFVIQTDDFVSPTAAGFKNALMPFKLTSDLPKQEDSSAWKRWTLTDMSKMPPDGSCMSMPPYPLSRFYYAIIKRDHTAGKHRGVAIASYLRLLFSPKVQEWIVSGSSDLLAAAPPAGLISNADALKRILLPADFPASRTYLKAPVEETKPEAMTNGPGMTPGMTPGAGMTKMAPSSTGAVIAMMTVLMSSGIVSVIIYLLLQKFYYKSSTTILDHASWLPFSLKSSPKSKSPAYEPLKSTHESRV